MDGPSQARGRFGLAELDLSELFGSQILFLFARQDRHLDELAIGERNIADHDLALVDGRCKDHGHTSSVAQTRSAPQQRVRQRNAAISGAAASGLAAARTQLVRFPARAGRN